MGVATLLALARAFIGPTTPDRIAAVDNMTTVMTSYFLIIALIMGSGIYIDVAMVYAIISFIGILVFARYLEGGI
jgi:multicomponent Na+:H+ antiporter subunit F